MPSVRPELGPTLPALLRRRFGLTDRRATVIVAGVVAGLAAFVVLLAARGDGLVQLDHRAEPQFTMLYDDGALDRVRPAPGELVRLRLEPGGRIRAAVTVERASLPRYRGTAIHGVAPIVMGRRLEAARAGAPAFRELADRRTRVNGAPGYEIAYRTGGGGRRTITEQVLLMEDAEARAGVLLTLRYVRGRRVSEAGRERIRSAKSAYRSFRFGLDRP